MTPIIKYISEYPEFAKAFFTWYSKHYKIPLATFINLPQLMQLPIIEEYIIDTHNLGINFDIGAIVIYYYNPELNVSEIMAKSNEGKFNFTVSKQFDLPILSYSDSFSRAIITTIKYIVEPF